MAEEKKKRNDDKTVTINGVDMMYGTGVKGSRDTNVSATPTFSGVITQGTKNVAHTLEIDKVSYEGLTDYVSLSNTIEEMLEVPGIVTVKEIKRPSGERPFYIKRTYYDCLTDGDDYEIKPEEHTVHNLKFKCGRMEKEVDYI